MASFDAEDVAELRALVAQAKRPRVAEALGKLVPAGADASAATESAAPAPSPATTPAAATTSATAEVSPSPPLSGGGAASTATAKPVPVAASARPADTAVVYQAITSYGWEQNREFVEVLCMDLKGVGALPAGAVTCDFTKAGFDLKVQGLGGKHYRLRITNLEKDIVPAKSRFEVKKSRVVLHLKKSGEWDHWVDLIAKKPRAAGESAGAKEDPGSAIMDMMKQMYEDGDSQTRKIIAEAWTKSREEQMKGGGKGSSGGFGGAAAGGFGGGAAGGPKFGSGLDDLDDL